MQRSYPHTVAATARLFHESALEFLMATGHSLGDAAFALPSSSAGLGAVVGELSQPVASADPLLDRFGPVRRGGPSDLGDERAVGPWHERMFAHGSDGIV